MKQQDIKSCNFTNEKVYKKFLESKIYIEIFLVKENYIGFCICEILGNNYRNQLTNFYFYPVTDICWLIFLELKEKKFIVSSEVLKIIIILQDIINNIKILQKQIAYKSFNSKLKQDLLKIFDKYSNVKIIGNTISEF